MTRIKHNSGMLQCTMLMPYRSDARIFNAFIEIYFNASDRGIKVLNCLGNNCACKQIGSQFDEVYLGKDSVSFLEKSLPVILKILQLRVNIMQNSTLNLQLELRHFRIQIFTFTKYCIPSNLQQLPE